MKGFLIGFPNRFVIKLNSSLVWSKRELTANAQLIYDYLRKNIIKHVN